MCKHPIYEPVGKSIAPMAVLPFRPNLHHLIKMHPKATPITAKETVFSLFICSQKSYAQNCCLSATKTPVGQGNYEMRKNCMLSNWHKSICHMRRLQLGFTIAKPVFYSH